MSETTPSAPRPILQKPSAAQAKAGAPNDQEKIGAVVGIGASAGGLKACEDFFAAVPADTGLAFVLITHLDPTHVSVLPELLKKQTMMTVVQAEDGMRVEPDRIYVIPPNKDMVIAQGTLVLTRPAAPRGFRLPIDTFFRSLAQDKKEKAIGIVLSGNGSDGTIGLKAIKAELGLVMVQDPSSAEYPSMPSSAIQAGVVDHVLSPDGLAAQLLRYVQQLAHPPAPILKGDEQATQPLQKLFELIRSKTGHDFSMYRQNAICRRIERRMIVHHIELLTDYVNYLEHNSGEITPSIQGPVDRRHELFSRPTGIRSIGRTAVGRHTCRQA